MKAHAGRAVGVARLELARLLRGRGRFGRLALLALPVVIAALGAVALVVASETPFQETLRIQGGGFRSAAESLTVLAQTFRLVLRVVLFLGAMELFASLYRSEMVDRTLHHLFLSPVHRVAALAGKYLAACATLGAALVVSWLVTTLLLFAPHGAAGVFGTLLSGDGLGVLLATILVIVLGVAAYGALFLLFGLVFSKPLHVAVVFWIWEWLVTFLPQSVKRFTVVHWLESLLVLRVAPDSMLARLADPEPRWIAVLVLLSITAAALAASAAWVRGMELSYGADTA